MLSIWTSLNICGLVKGEDLKVDKILGLGERLSTLKLKTFFKTSIFARQ